jgi:hypothetical protein
LADVADGVAGQRRLQVRRVRWLARLPQRNRRHPCEIGRGDEPEHARPRQGVPTVETNDARVSVRTPHEDRVRHAGPDQVVDVAPAAHEQARIFEPLDRSADELHRRGMVPSAS